MARFKKKLSKQQLRQRVKSNWAAWRLIYSDGGFDYTTVFYKMTPQEIEEANLALDRKIELEKRQIRKK